MPSAQYRIEDFNSAQTLAHMDETVCEIFGMMLGLAAVHDDSRVEIEAGEEELTGLIGFSGALRGSCEIRMSATAARTIATAMLGGPPVDDEDSINDAVGEISNMFAGGWKNRVDALAGKCFLSPPAVISGTSYKVHPSHGSVKIVRHYTFDAHSFQIAINCVEIAAG